jgi:hypothetical protein
MKVRMAWYWPTPIRKGELAGLFHVVDGRIDGGPIYRLLVDVDWVAVSPLPELRGLPPTQGFFTSKMGEPEAARVAVLRWPADQAFFASELAEQLAASEGLEVVEEAPANHVDYRGVARGDGHTGYLSVVQHEGLWHALFGLGSDDDPQGLDGVRASWATFHLVPADEASG